MAKLLLVLKMIPHMTAVMWRRLFSRDRIVIESHEIPESKVPADLILLEQLDQLKKMGE